MRAVKRVARTVADRSYAVLASAAAKLGYDVVRRDYHSPVPDLGRLPAAHFGQPQPMPGVAWDLDAQLAFLERDLAPHIAAFAPHPGFRLANDSYESVDAETAWAIVRHLEPARIVELGSGFTTLVLAAALEANGAGALRVFDPYPRAALPARVDRVPAQEVPIDVFLELAAGDVLFVDTTHTVKAGSEVNRIVLEILPQLTPGVAVHFHDVFLPYEYPLRWLRDRRFFWAEQYLLQAFLACNERFEVLLAANALVRAHPDRVAAVVPSFAPGVEPGAFWIRAR